MQGDDNEPRICSGRTPCRPLPADPADSEVGRYEAFWLPADYEAFSLLVAPRGLKPAALWDVERS